MKKWQIAFTCGSPFLLAGCLLEHWIGQTFSTVLILIAGVLMWWGIQLQKRDKQNGSLTEPISREKRVSHIGWVIFAGGVSCVIGFFMLRLHHPQFGVATHLLICSFSFLLILGIAYWRLRQIRANRSE